MTQESRNASVLRIDLSVRMNSCLSLGRWKDSVPWYHRIIYVESLPAVLAAMANGSSIQSLLLPPCDSLTSGGSDDGDSQEQKEGGEQREGTGCDEYVAVEEAFGYRGDGDTQGGFASAFPGFVRASPANRNAVASLVRLSFPRPTLIGADQYGHVKLM